MLLLFLDWKKSPKDKSQLPWKQIHYLLKRLKCAFRKSQTAVAVDWQTLKGSFMFTF